MAGDRKVALTEYVDIVVSPEDGRRFTVIITGPLEYWCLFAERFGSVRVSEEELRAFRAEPETR